MKMSTALDRLNNNLAVPSKTQTAGKGLAVAGASGIVLSVLAALLPFVGVLGVSVVAGIIGLLLIAKR
jgi:hypothetical protein